MVKNETPFLPVFIYNKASTITHFSKECYTASLIFKIRKSYFSTFQM
jgi:hypothetical protein